MENGSFVGVGDEFASVGAETYFCLLFKTVPKARQSESKSSLSPLSLTPCPTSNNKLFQGMQEGYSTRKDLGETFLISIVRTSPAPTKIQNGVLLPLN